MELLTNLGRVTKESQRFFINTTEIPGVQSVNASFDTSAQPLRYLGAGNHKFSPVGPQIGNLSFNCLLISNDLILPFTGNSGFCGYILQSRNNTNNNFSFTSGCLSSYTTRTSIGQIPQIEGKIDIFGNIGTFIEREPKLDGNPVLDDWNIIAGQNSTDLLKITGPGSINFNINDLTTNRLQSYDLTINTPRNANYVLGQNYPAFTEINWPIEVILNLSIEKNDYNGLTMRDFPFNTSKRDNVNLTIKDYDNNSTLISYSFNNMLLSNQSYSVDVNKNVSINLQYKTYLAAPIN